MSVRNFLDYSFCWFLNISISLHPNTYNTFFLQFYKKIEIFLEQIVTTDFLVL
jgi:hypothetical protein